MKIVKTNFWQRLSHRSPLAHYTARLWGISPLWFNMLE